MKQDKTKKCKKKKKKNLSVHMSNVTSPMSVGRHISPYSAKTQRAADALVYATTVNDWIKEK